MHKTLSEYFSMVFRDGRMYEVLVSSLKTKLVFNQFHLSFQSYYTVQYLVSYKHTKNML